MKNSVGSRLAAAGYVGSAVVAHMSYSGRSPTDTEGLEKIPISQK